MHKRKLIGSGVTRRWRDTWTVPISQLQSLSKKVDALHCKHGGYVDPRADFAKWLDHREATIAEALKHFRLPAPNRLVAYETNDPRNWRYINASAPKSDLHMTFNRTEWYLQHFSEQSSFWYLGRILFAITQCKHALKERRVDQLAGCALLLGEIDAEFDLKLTIEKRYPNFEFHDEASRKGNRTKTAQALVWREIALKIIKGSPSIDSSNGSQAARDVLKRWPANKKAPSQRSLRSYLAKRPVMPEA